MEKTHWKKVKGTDYLGEWSIQDEDLILTIKTIGTEMVPNSRGEKDEKYVIHFDECKEGLVVSAKVVLEAIAKACGSNYIEDWIGHKIALYKEHGRWFGKEQDAVRVRDTEPAVIICEDCGKVIKSAWGMSAIDVAQNSLKKFGRKLCAECSVKAKETK